MFVCVFFNLLLHLQTRPVEFLSTFLKNWNEEKKGQEGNGQDSNGADGDSETCFNVIPDLPQVCLL